MNRTRLRGALGALLVLARLTLAQETAAAPPPQEPPKPPDDTLRVFWKDGLRFESMDKRFKLKIGGRINYDTSFFSPDDDTKDAVETGTTRIEDGTEFRRARIELSGEVGDRVEWQSNFDFAGGGNPNFRGVWAGIKELPFGSFRAGQFKEPYGLEQITSSNNILFLERSLMNAFVPAYNGGFMAFDQIGKEERMTWSLGVFRSGTDNGEVTRGEGEWAGTARVTGLPLWGDEGRDYVHLGAAFSYRNPHDDMQTYSSKPEANLAPAYVSATVEADNVMLLGGEAGWTQGPFTLSGEYTQSMIDAPSGAASEPTFDGYYAQASYFLTGEARPYSKTIGAFGAVKPVHNAFAKDGGWGAWELKTRYSSIDLTDDGTEGGEMSDISAGVNWYLNANTRVMMDYVLASLDPATGSDGDTGILLFRVQFNY